MRIGVLSALTGLSRDTIRFYERQGLIASASATSTTNSYRHYGDDLPERLRMITDARSAGLSVADLKLLLTFMECGDPGAIDINGFLDQRISQMEHNISQSRKLLKTLKMTRDALVVSAPNPAKSENTT